MGCKAIPMLFRQFELKKKHPHPYIYILESLQYPIDPIEN